MGYERSDDEWARRHPRSGNETGPQDVANRATELLAKLVDALGSDKTPVRIGGLYALGHLGRDNVDHRQTIEDVICGCLRTPFEMPAAGQGDVPDQETLQVRVTAQRILRDHLQPGDNPDQPLEGYWQNIDLDLIQATLVDFDLHDCRVGVAQFDRVNFIGSTDFRGTYFADACSFRYAQFKGYPKFGGSVFAGEAVFSDARFEREPNFSGIPAFDGDDMRRPAIFLRGVPPEVAEFGAVASDEDEDEDGPTSA